MDRTVLLILLTVTTLPAQADWFYRLVGYDCDKQADRLVVRYKGAYNEAGKAMVEAKNSTEWEPGSLIASMRDDDHIGELKIVDGVCKLRHATYRIRIGPTPGNFNIQGRCGGEITAWVEVWRERRLVLPHYELEGDCHDTEALVTTEISFNRSSSHPAFIIVQPSEFIQ